MKEILSRIPDSILREDIRVLAESGILDDLAAGAAVLITGATGLIGSQTLKALACYSVRSGKDIKLIAAVRSAEKAKTVFGDLLDRGLAQLLIADINEPLCYDGPVDYIIHGASATSSRYFVEKPAETIMTAVKGTQNVLELARSKQVKKMVYLSSLEVYGTPDGTKEYITEADYGYIDPMQARSSYSEGKRMAECLCAAYAKEYGVNVTVARLSQTFGAGVDYNDGRVFAEFARCAIEGRDIVLHTQGRTVRTYCYLTDAVNGIFCLMLRGEPGQAYNVTNMETAVSIREMAQMVCDQTPGIAVKVEIPEEIASFGYNPEMIIRLDSGKLQALGWKPQVGMEQMLRRLIESMKM